MARTQKIKMTEWVKYKTTRYKGYPITFEQYGRGRGYVYATCRKIGGKVAIGHGFTKVVAERTAKATIRRVLESRKKKYK